MAKIAILRHQLRHLLLQTVILLHQKLIHCRQLPIHGLEARGLLPLLLSAPEKIKNSNE